MSDTSRAAPPLTDFTASHDPAVEADLPGHAENAGMTSSAAGPADRWPAVEPAAASSGNAAPTFAASSVPHEPGSPTRSPPRRPAPLPPKRDRGLGWVNAALVYSGAALLGASIYQKKRTSAAEAGHPPIGRFLDADGATFHYVDLGEGPPIVLLHGIGSTLDDWFVSGVLDRILPHHRIIAIDRPGYGYSSRPGGIRWTPERQARAMARMLHRLGAHEATVVAHSFGVLPALALALQHPTFARNLVLIGGVFMPGSSLGRLSKAVPSVPLLGPLARGSISPALARAAIPSMVRSMFEPQPVTRTFRERFSIDFATRPGQIRAAADDLGAIDGATRRFAPHYGELDVPVTVVTGSGDAIFDPDRQSRPFAAAVPDASLVVIPAGGHLVHHTSPDLVSEVILETAAGRIKPSDLGPPPDVGAGPLATTSQPDPESRPASEPASAETSKRAASQRSEQASDPQDARKPEPRSRPEPADGEAVKSAEGTSRDQPAKSRDMSPEASGRAKVDDATPDSVPAEAADPPALPSSVGPASSATAASAGAEASTKPDAGAASGDGNPGGAAAEDEEKAAPQRRRSRSRRKTT